MNIKFVILKSSLYDPPARSHAPPRISYDSLQVIGAMSRKINIRAALEVSLLILQLATCTRAWIPYPGQGLVAETTEAASAILKRQPNCSFLVFTDGATSSSDVFQLLQRVATPWGVGVFESAVDYEDMNATEATIVRLVGEARRLRKASWCVSVVVLSDDPAFLASFAESSLRGRLLVWATRLLVVTRLPLQELRRLLASSWTFSMMNTMVVHREEENVGYGFGKLENTARKRWRVYAHLPYSPVGARMAHVASWTPRKGLVIKPPLSLFPEKFSNFYGALVNVTGLPYPPYWDVIGEEEAPDGTKREVYSGTDYRLLQTVAETLNFTFQVIPTSDWDEIFIFYQSHRLIHKNTVYSMFTWERLPDVQKWDPVVYHVEIRNAILAGVFHILLPQRMEHFDYTFAYEYSFFAFSLTKPKLRPKWQSLYYPLANEVWISIVATLFLAPAVMLWVRRFRPESSHHAEAGAVTMEVLGTLLGQNFYKWLPISALSRMLVASWLVFAFILGTAYRGNLTAALTLPKYPPRPETIEELVETVDLVTMPPYGVAFRNFFRDSDSKVFQTLADCMEIGPSIMEGLRRATGRKIPFMATRRNLAHTISDQFTRIDGSTKLYIGRENVFPGLSGWPVPHDAPYKHELDWIIMAVIEGGLYERWSDEETARTQKESRQRLKERLKEEQERGQDSEDAEEVEAEGTLRPLTLTHMQGPLFLLLLGVAAGAVAFVAEVVLARCLDRE
ncbi:ionotropic receptor 21a-like [Penaeus vannamei]|uniref:ionotropic receptor 21a-like n=1 Tax=Penaeus vannamei TaxID=6689 RepID=UPI00387F5B3C